MHLKCPPKKTKRHKKGKGHLILKVMRPRPKASSTTKQRPKRKVAKPNKPVAQP